MRISTSLLQLAYAALAIFVIGMLLEHHDAVCGVLRKVDLFMVLVAGIVSLLYRFVNASVWGVILNGLGASMSHLAATQIWLTTEALRWLPGARSLRKRASIAQRLGLSRGLVNFSLTVELAITILAWGFTMGAGLWFSGLLPNIYAAMPPLALPIVSIGGAFLLGSLWLTRQRLLPRTIRSLPLAGRDPICKGSLVTSLVFYMALCVINGVGFYLLLQAFPQGKLAVSLSAAIGINAAGWLAGFFTIGAPGGLGAREIALVGMLSPFYVSLETVVLFVSTWRLLQIMVEAVTLATVAATRHLRPATHFGLSPSA